MSEQVLVQFRADKALKNEVTSIFESLGLDLPTAIRMFLARSRAVRGIPFEVTLPETEPQITRAEAWQAFQNLREQASDVPEMTMEEINAEIAAIRAERRTKS